MERSRASRTDKQCTEKYYKVSSALDFEHWKDFSSVYRDVGTAYTNICDGETALD